MAAFMASLADFTTGLGLAETAITGAAMGAALEGLRPIAEIQFADFITPAMDQIVNMIGKYHYRTHIPVPLVIRTPAGAIVTAHGSTGPLHSQSPEAWFAHAPGLKIVVPSNAFDAKGLLFTAIDDPNPVLFFEQKRLYNDKMDVPGGRYGIPFGQLRVARTGLDLTVVTYGSMVPVVLNAVQQIAAHGIETEVLDLRTLVPLDRQGIIKSVQKTGKVLIVHEANRTCGFGAEVAALISEYAFEYLDAPIRRLTPPDIPVPSARHLAEAYLPNVNDVIQAIQQLNRY